MTDKIKANPYRLDKSFEPLSYLIELEPDLKAFTFRGRETVCLKARNPFSKIMLHALELKITKASLRFSSKGIPHPAGKITYNPKFETADIRFKKTFPPGGPFYLDLEFDGTLNDKMHGFYRTSYDVRGEKRWGAATQFEATDARRAFPCWDEPDRKAVFRVALRVPRHLTALSNMPVSSETPVSGTGLNRILYEPTPKMSTYLVALVVADLEYSQTRDKNGVLIRVWTTPGKKAQGLFALKTALHTLPYFARWFGIPYALPKLDMVALPDFASGAMENWGLVTYRETALLVDPKNSSAQARQRVAEVIDHELAHQWFGNLVTMEWWTDLWLNEGFASFMGPKAVDAQFPSWRIWNQHIATEYLSALHNDSLKNSHPIEIPVQNPHEIREIFDEITYSKGSSVNRMLEHYLGEPLFRRGLSIYLKRYSYRNAKTRDLWSVLEEVSGKPVKAMMASFTKQEGYPVLIAGSKQAGRRTSLFIEQKRFLFDGSTDPKKRWTVPVGILLGGSQKPIFSTLRSKNMSLLLPQSAEKWLKINPGQSGFHRTAYSEELLRNLLAAIRRKRLSPVDCFGIADDALALARAGLIRTSDALDLWATIGSSYQTDYNVWLTLAGALAEVENIFENEGTSSSLHRFSRELFRPVYRRFGWNPKPDDSHLEKLLRSLVIGRMGHYADPKTIREAGDRFRKFTRGGVLAPDLRSAVYSIAAEHGGPADYEKLLSIYKKSGLQEEKVRVLRALTRFKRKEIIRRALDFALSPGVRAQDTFILLAGFGGNQTGRPIAWEFIKSNWKTLTKRYAGGGLGLMTRVIEGATSGFTTAQELSDAGKFFRKHPVPGTERSVKQSLETIRANITWRLRDSRNVQLWFSSKKLL